jgi:hypothetical protein
LAAHQAAFIEAFWQKEVARVQKKHLQGWKKREKQELMRAVAISRYAFPKQQLQERYLSSSAVIMTYGQSILDQILAAMDKPEWKSKHLLLRIPQPTNRG